MSDGVKTWFDDAELDRERWGGLVEGALERVAAAAAANRLAHALLLVGPRAMGRELAAVELAALLTCPRETGPWCACGSCRRARGGGHPDVVALFPRLNPKTGKPFKLLTIEPMRDEVVTAADGRPFEGRRRVWIFSSMHTEEPDGITTEAANAFLKTLEEPPSHCTFLLLAANPDAVLPTIRSRCQRVALPGLVAVARGLGEAAAPELAAEAAAGVAVDDELAAVRAALADRSPLELLRAARRLADLDSGFELAASACLAAAADSGPEHGEDLVRLARDLVAAGRRTRVLNLSAERQILTCLLDWHRLRVAGGERD